jgi:hypothetical protein
MTMRGQVRFDSLLDVSKSISRVDRWSDIQNYVPEHVGAVHVE